MGEVKLRKQGEKRMKRGSLVFALVILILGLTGCGKNELEGDCKCTIALLDVPKELEMLDENLLEEFNISVRLENIYTEKTIDVRLTAANDFCQELKLQPGTYLIKYTYAGPVSLIPVEVEVKQEKIELTRGTPLAVDVVITNRKEFADWAWDMEASREILEESAFSGEIQFEGQMIDVTRIADYVEFEQKSKIPAYEKETLTNSEKGVSIVVQNTGDEAVNWRECELIKVSFKKNNVIWGQGAFVGMDVTKAVHAQKGLYGAPYAMSGTVLAGLGYTFTYVSYLDPMSGDKLTLEIVPDGDYISGISYELKVFE